jgi:multidrug efflux pump subunit AcrB/nucleotide-binding universal stress UspA family protein
MREGIGFAGKLAHAFINSKLTPLVIAASVLLGLGAVFMLPREEEPQIIVPMIDVMVEMPGASAKEVEERVTKPMEKLLWEIPGIEYIYSTSSPGFSMAIVRFKVGQNEEDSIVRLNQKMFANFDLIPQGASQPIIKPRSIDDVPILALTLSSDRYDHFTLRRIASQVHDQIKEIQNVSEVKIIGGQRRQVRVLLDESRMASRNIAPAAIIPILEGANKQLQSGSFSANNREVLVETGGFLHTAEDVGNVVVGVFNNAPVYLRDVAKIEDGAEEASDYVLFGNGVAATHNAHDAKEYNSAIQPAVTIAVSKRKGTNAIEIADHVIEKVNELKGSFIPSDVVVTTTRNYGETASEKSNELLLHMIIAIASVTALILLTLGFRESGIVAIAIPVTLALTLAVFYFYGYTLNRITLFALIFSIGILVDDAIVVVENITRHYRLPENKDRNILDIAVEAVDEVGNPTILATFAVIAAILPMAFVSGLMGPYMRPIPIGASAAMIFSLLVAFIVTPWASYRLLKREGNGHSKHEHGGEGFTTRLYRRVMKNLIEAPVWRYSFLALVVLLLLGSLSLVGLKIVRVKMLPFDNKSEFQVIVDMPEGATLEETAAVTRELGQYVSTVPEVVNYQMYVGTASPYNFNGLVRHYFLRRGANVADIQVNLLSKDERSAQSHDIAKRVRPDLQKIAARYGARIKVAEVPPGPPVLQTLVAEIYGPDYKRQIEIAKQIRDIFDKMEGVVDVDWYVEDDQTKYIFVVDREKAALNGIMAEQVAATLRVAVDGMNVGLLHQPQEKEDVTISLRLPRAERSSIEDLKQIKVVGQKGNLVPLGELVRVKEQAADKSIYHKNLMPVVYVTGDVAGKVESPVYAILQLNNSIDELKLAEGYSLERYVASQPFIANKYAMKWDGEWHITYEVFRDLGIAFAVVLVLIYILVVGWFQSFKTPLTIMAAIPFSLVGILPAHGLMGAFFTATSMIGFIAGAGIVVRNSIILVDFVELRLKQGMPLAEAVVDAGAVRFRPMMLTAAAVIVGSAVMLFDPIFQGLAISLMAGEVASLLLSRMTVPILFYLSERKKEKAKTKIFHTRTILVPTDFSEIANVALKYAKEFARVLGSRLTVMHAQSFEPPVYFTSKQLEELSKEFEQSRQTTLEKLNDYVKENIEDEFSKETLVVEEEPASAVLKTAQEFEADLIVMGTHGHGKIESLLLGSVAEGVLREAACPVLTVNPQVKISSDEELSIKRILCPVNMTEVAREALEYATMLARSFSAELLVVKVIEDENESEEEHLKTLCDWIPSESRLHCDVKELVARGNVVEQIVTLSEENKADLIVLGAQHKLFRDKTIIYATTASVVRNAHCPVLTVTKR